jgi:GNAT superfamily N-acetyltransferase
LLRRGHVDCGINNAYKNAWPLRGERVPEVVPGAAPESIGDLVAAARVLTDYASYAKVFEVIVAADRRGEGFGRESMDGVVEHPDLQSVGGLSLRCREGPVPFYESVGFELFDPEMEVPEGGTDELVGMTDEQD